ncbi:MAG: D-alanyl-D-alanine carboxypeptidase [Lachnospiraceae bacterium]|nr:D-alanyl-D-alanine carboxypeptidase [Lachnospiraceae bacterium]
MTGILFMVLITAGCGKNEYDLAFDPYHGTGAVSVSDDGMALCAHSFAENLCVTDGDISAGTDVDLSHAAAGALFDLKNANVIYAKNVHERLYPASLTKVMTALVALKYGNPEDLITVSGNAAGITESGAQLCGLKQGDTLTLNQALHALLMYSANDAGVAIAEQISGSVTDFAELMNKEAAALGATNCQFKNPHGLQDEAHYVTAYDLYLIFNEAMKYELFTEIIRSQEYQTTYHDRAGKEKSFNFHTTNQYLAGNYEPPANVTVIGGKTGTTNAAGNCLILLSKDKSGASYISVILRCDERQILYEEMTDLLSEISK